MNEPNCKICRAPNRRRLVEADWADGISAEGIARTMREAGWPLSSATVLKHLKEHTPGAATREPVKAGKRDAAIFLQNRLMDEIERREELVLIEEETTGEKVPDHRRLDILDKDLQPALATILRAQALINTREKAKGPRAGMMLLMLGVSPDGLGPGALAPLELSSGEEDDDIIDGEAIEVD
jgi:hypothetical protein